MILKERLDLLSELLLSYKDFYSQLDEDVLRNDYFTHPWIDQLISLDEKNKRAFDADRDHSLLQCTEWKRFIKLKQIACHFPKREISPSDDNLLGNKKKRHELTQLKSLLSVDAKKKSVDFGGGVGNLGYFLHTELGQNVHILERDQNLINKGKEKLKEYSQSITFQKCSIDRKSHLNLTPYQVGIGLHTCGNFSTDIFRVAIKNKLPKLINFGCCYSKIVDHDYNLSLESDKRVYFNSRALSFATLGFEKIPHDFFEFRQKIIHYKLSFYHWLYQTHQLIDFKPMSNSRRNLYQQSISHFFEITLSKYFPHLEVPHESEIKRFYKSQENQDFLSYLWAYYAIARYFGEVIEAYLLTDRALFLQNNGYNVEIIEVFDPKLSPRNKVIIAET